MHAICYGCPLEDQTASSGEETCHHEGVLKDTEDGLAKAVQSQGTAWAMAKCEKADAFGHKKSACVMAAEGTTKQYSRAQTVTDPGFQD